MKLSRKESLLYLVCFFLCVSHVSVRHLITRNAYIGDEELKLYYGLESGVYMTTIQG